MNCSMFWNSDNDTVTLTFEGGATVIFSSLEAFGKYLTTTTTLMRHVLAGPVSLTFENGPQIDFASREALNAFLEAAMQLLRRSVAIKEGKKPATDRGLVDDEQMPEPFREAIKDMRRKATENSDETP